MLCRGSTSVVLLLLKGTIDNQIEFEKETRIFKLNHPNVVKALGTYRVRDKNFYLVTEYCKWGTLTSYLSRFGREMTIHKQLDFSLQIALACKYLEEYRIVQREISTRTCQVAEAGRDTIIKVTGVLYSVLTFIDR